MKITILLLSFFCNFIFSQSFSKSQSSEDILMYYKSNLNSLKEKNGNLIVPTAFYDSLVLNGMFIDSHFGYSVSYAGDVNSDGYSDVIIGADGLICRAYIFYGGEIVNNIADVTFEGKNDTRFGNSVSNAGDVNGDGYSDVIIGACKINSAFIFYGGISMNNIPDVFLLGEVTSSNFGISVSSADDLNNDGFSDVVIGAPDNIGNIGKSYVYYGGDNMDNVADLKLSGTSTNNFFGWCVSEAGDLNNDSFSDLIIGAYGYSSNKGRSYVYFGGSNMDSTVDLILNGESVGNAFGGFLSSAGDFNNDGFSDIIVGAPFYSNNTGRAYIYFGGNSMDSIADIIFTGENIESNFGYEVAKAGDLNSDGYSDVIVGANKYNNFTGRVYLFYGGVKMNNIADVILTGDQTGSEFGCSLSGVNNFNGDGFDDIIIGASNYSPNNTGKSYLYLGLNPVVNLKVKLLFEGMYSSAFNQLLRKDSVIAYLRQSLPPYNIIDSSKTNIDTILFSGLFKFYNAKSGTYYITIKHLNSIETWSKAGGENLVADGSIYNYDFTSASSQTYGNNSILKGSKYCLYSGDVNQDGYVTLFDLIPIYNDATNFVGGNYLPTDLTGDGILDLTDVTLCYNNSSSFVRIRQP